MNTLSQAPFQSADMLGLLSKYRRLIITGTVLTWALFMLAAFVLPKRYKSFFELSIYSTYFQNPMIRDFTPEIFDSAEMRAQREGLIRQAMSPEFLDALGQKYGMYASRTPGLFQRFLSFLGKKYGVYLTTREMRARSEERKDLMARIQVLNLNSDTFQVSFAYSNPDVTYHVIQDIHGQVTRGLLDVRRNNLTGIHNAIEKRLEALASRLPTLDKAPSSPSALPPRLTEHSEANVPMVEEELADVRSQLRVLTARYTDEHPLVKELRDREKSLMSLANASSSGSKEKPLAIRVPQDAAAEIYRELTKKLNYLNVALDSDQFHASDFFATLASPLYPASPLWPKKSLFCLWGLGAGLLGSVSVASLREYFDRAAMRPPLLSEQLGVPIIGDMPFVRWGAAFPNSLWSGLSERAGSHN